MEPTHKVKKMDKAVKVLMCCSSLNFKGGMVSVVKNFLSYKDWEEFDIKYIPTHTDGNAFIKSLYFLVAYLRIVFFIIFRNPKIIYLHMAERGSVFRKAIILRTAKLFKKRVIIHHHSAEFEIFYDSLKDSTKKYVSETLEMADVNIVLSNRLVSMVKERAHNATVEVVYNAVSIPASNLYNKCGSKILFLGQLGKRKGTYDLLRAIQKIDDSLDPKYQFCLCGDGEVEEVKQKVCDLGITNRVCKIGWISTTEKQELFKDVVINVLPSYNEGLPMSILETMAFGIPNISTRIAAIPEVVADGVNGILINPGDVNQLAEAIKRLVGDSELREMYSDNSWKLINERFSMDRAIMEIKNIMRSLCEDK